MKYRLSLLLLAVCLLSGCVLFSGEYHSSSLHSEQKQPETSTESQEQATSVHNRSELRGVLLSFVREWRESGELLADNYEGDLAQDLTETLRYVTQEDPVGAYAVDYADASQDGARIHLRIVFRRSAAEIDAIVSTRNTTGALDRIFQMLENNKTSLTIRINSYEDVDFNARIREYCLAHLGTVAAIPQVSAQLYPNSGSTRILELHLTYPLTEAELSVRLQEVSVLLESAQVFISEGQTPQQRLSLLYHYLKNRFSYTLRTTEPSMPAYSLLYEGEMHSLSLSAICHYEFEVSGMEGICEMVQGTLNSSRCYWNTLTLSDGTVLCFDLLRSLQNSEESVRLYSTEEFIALGYRGK